MVDTNQKASDVGISLLQEQRAETKKREDDIKSCDPQKMGEAQLWYKEISCKLINWHLLVIP